MVWVKLVFMVGYGAQALVALRKILEEESKLYSFEYLAVPADGAEGVETWIESSDAIFIYAPSLPPSIEEAVKRSKAKLVLSPSEPLAHLSKCPPELLARSHLLYCRGGPANLRSLVRLMLNNVGVEVEEGGVEEVPWHGIWHPVYGHYYDPSLFLSRYPYRDRPLVGVLFYRSHWLYGNLDPVKALVEALEAEGLGAIPVFTYGFRNPGLGSPSAEDSIKAFFMAGGRPLVDLIINLTSFFLLDRDRRSGFHEAPGLDLLRSLNVPVIQAVHSHYRSVEEWLKDPQGLDYLSQVYVVIMPEVDGLAEPIVLAGSRVDDEGVKRYEAFLEHAKYLARRAKRWIQLRRKNPRERKVAIVLINPPCKGLESSVAVGLGLDVPESVVRLLRRLKELGYEVGDKVPESGDALIKEIMERRALSEFRWTSVEDIVKRGGAAAFVDPETYMEWFNELPADVREKMIEDWGHPLDVLEGRVAKELVGMVYQGRFVVPGLILGNVFITPQPKFGCAGPACDGKVCKILHDPTVTPPHQWLAVYRWITRVFKADVVVHFGTHGYLEFRPGKGVGLSPSCWPEISIDDAPHLYVYAVSNPMEGVIAKRRGYAVLIDHLYPPMSTADVLEDLDSIIAQYFHAKQLGDLARAKLLYEELLKKAKENHIKVSSEDPDKAVEEVHRYVSMVRGTQIEKGLHVFGHPPTDKEVLAEYVATAMAYDSHSLPSIRRVLAEFLGLDYEELRAKPETVNRLGLTNAATLDLLHRLAVRTIRRLLEERRAPGEVTPELASKIVVDELGKVLGRG
ncbi:MAG: hypothetical protein DRJ97_06975 [Thermoprotei archaeon]|nr:MAG: hypothetical protein DRJ97_06975 [Thermoprotei archaeon]